MERSTLMVLDRKRTAIDPILVFFAKRLRRFHPDVFTWFALLFALISGIFFALSTPQNETSYIYLIVASFFVFLNGLFDAIDGKIAKLTKKSSKRGDFLDHALDRYADIFIVGGIALSPWCDMKFGLLALIGIFLTSYLGTQAQAVGFKRVYAGLLGRADRLIILIFIPIIQFILIQNDIINILNFSLIEWAMIYIAVMGNITALQRFYATLQFFKEKK
jgi:archaetidylinositol phosphate synthase